MSQTKSMHHPNKLPIKPGYGFQGLIAVMVVALASVGGYAYLRASDAASTYIGVAATPNGTPLKLQADGCVNGSGPVCNVALNKGATGIGAYGGNNGGYWVVAGDGGVFAAGGAPYGGSMSGKALAQPIKAIAGRASSGGYWLLGGDGGVFAFNGAPYYGGGNQRVAGATDFVAIASTPSGNGYWLLRSGSGAVYPFGDAAGQITNTGGSAVSIAGGYGASNGYWVLHSGGTVTTVGSVGNPGNIAAGLIGLTRLYSNSSNCLYGINGGGGAAEICPTPVPTISASPASIAYGASSTISWNSTSADSCTIPGLASATSGRRSTGALTSSRGYNITCSNALHSASKPTTVSVAAAPPPPKPGGGGTTGGTTGGSTGSSGGTSSSGHSSSGHSSSGGTSTATPDTTPPTLPANFNAQLDSQVVDVSWNASTDNVGVDHYELDRSLDQTVWTSISDHVNATTYTDQTVGFGTTYYYRLRAIDGAGNASDYATTQITTGAFTANSSSDKATTVTSDDNIVVATIPASAFSDQADCSIITDSNHADKLPLKKAALITGPYSLLCKKQDGSTIDKFASPVAFTVKLTTDQNKRYRGFSFYNYASSGNWGKFKTTYNKKTKVYGFTSSSPVQFAVLGSIKKGLSAQVVILIIMFILLVAGVAYYLYQRARKQNYQDYIRKKYYNL